LIRFYWLRRLVVIQIVVVGIVFKMKTHEAAAMVGGLLGGVLGAGKLLPFEYIEQLEDPADIIDVGMAFAKSLE
jgi:hypothetical protein